MYVLHWLGGKVFVDAVVDAVFVAAPLVGAIRNVDHPDGQFEPWEGGSHKGCRYIIDGYVFVDTAVNVKAFVAAPLVGAISNSGSGVGA
ncbi:hypothetical protein EDC26_103152 [Paralcaligenes ureilyticus]|uniref:Uncharacterized protein n=1 Tax=Paralcaligenes ureilyticus TaxID=627131 RepID=A0A4R3MA49_9BURK|nr:hypothetical protein EDC26_103152 [Paralcaligenes ureilyticus]